MRTLLAFVLLTSTASAAPIFFFQSGYASKEDSPFDLEGGQFVFEDFEDGSIGTPGLIINGSSQYVELVGPGQGVISVENGAQGHSLRTDVGWYNDLKTGGGQRKTLYAKQFTFDFRPSQFGAGPMAFGFVLTQIDASAGAVGAAQLRIYDSSGALVGNLVKDRIDLAPFHFVGATYPGGIGRAEFGIAVFDESAQFQIDHLQYGVPEPSGGVLGAIGALASLLFLRIRRH